MAASTPPVRGARSAANARYRFIRQLHLWLGAWGAIAALLFGLTGLLMNHRFGDNPWPQGKSEEVAQARFAVPAASAGSAESLSMWLRDVHGLDAHTIRKPKPDEGRKREGKPAGAEAPKWNLSGGNARNSWSAEFTAGSDAITVKHSRQTSLAALNRLHKGVGGGLLWTLLSDSYAIAMIVLGISGIWMWMRGRTPRQMLFSVMGLGLAVLASVMALALS
ncbi:hypothetical protein DCD74_07625 [Lysobacter oculi]|uniref:Peptidase n=1 Tax=Solilutibacter oculi TaxID=2698682 RepID=A0A344J6A9_9GAMM|nr:PepSY-associated TM helix domain-containing protein [Lysobacter oculi]AXA84569.1 hypothetical protein DCD74_07625 [Lysobacter oculi]